MEKLSQLIDAMGQGLDNVGAFFASILDFFTDPFIPVLLTVLVIIALAAVVKWFFPSRNEPGYVAVLAAFFAWAFRKGERAERDRHSRK